MIAEHFDRNLDARYYAGEPIEVELQLTDAAGAIEDPTGRAFVLAIYRADRSRLASAAGVVPAGSAAYVAFAIDGNATEAAVGLSGLRYELAEVIDAGRLVLAAGRLTVATSAEAPGAVFPGASAGGPVSRFSIQMLANRPRIVVTQRGGTGAPGLTAAQQLYDAGIISAPSVEAMDARFSASEYGVLILRAAGIVAGGYYAQYRSFRADRVRRLLARVESGTGTADIVLKVSGEIVLGPITATFDGSDLVDLAIIIPASSNVIVEVVNVVGEVTRLLVVYESVPA
jgi:hypothetical protein